MTTEQATPPPVEETFDVIGTRPIRHDGPDKVTGRARYAADIHPPGWLVGKVLRAAPTPMPSFVASMPPGPWRFPVLRPS